MEDIGFILATYVATFVGVVGLTAYYVVRGRRLAEQLPPEDKPWT
jgi:heme/copper-type cytochrome/quinol oxidase subunit 2